jgi:hypothetical protein
VQLNPISEEEVAEEVVRGKRESTEDEGHKHYPESCGRSWGSLRFGHADFICIIFQELLLGGLAQVFLHELGAVPIPDGGRIGIARRSGFLGLLGDALGIAVGRGIFIFLANIYTNLFINLNYFNIFLLILS